MENLGLEKIHNLPVYKCEVSRDLTVMKRRWNSGATVEEKLHVKNYLWKSKEKEARTNLGCDPKETRVWGYKRPPKKKDVTLRKGGYFA